MRTCITTGSGRADTELDELWRAIEGVGGGAAVTQNVTVVALEATDSGVPGEQGAEGAQGPEGPQGPPGEPGADGESGFRKAFFSGGW